MNGSGGGARAIFENKKNIYFFKKISIVIWMGVAINGSKTWTTNEWESLFCLSRSCKTKVFFYKMDVLVISFDDRVLLQANGKNKQSRRLKTTTIK